MLAVVCEFGAACIGSSFAKASSAINSHAFRDFEQGHAHIHDWRSRHTGICQYSKPRWLRIMPSTRSNRNLRTI